jgi:hypothetical protein
MSPTSMVISLGSPVVQNLRYPHINIDQILVLKEGKVLKKHYCSVVPGKKKARENFTRHNDTSQLNLSKK